MPATPRHDPPVCVYCDNDLSCDRCGMEQPYTDISIMRAALRKIADLIDSEADDPLDDAISIAKAAIQSEKTP